MRRPSIFFLALLVGTACPADDTDPLSSASNPTAAPTAGGSQGNTGDETGTSDSGGTGPTSGEPTGSTSGGTTTMTTGSDIGGPQFIDLVANTAQISSSDTVVFTAFVTDPDGLDTILGGKLTSEDGSAFYGAFASLGGGTYELALSWTQISQSQEIEFIGATQQRVFLADFFDDTDKHGKRTVAVTLACESGAACDGSCVDVKTNENHCGMCGNACEGVCEEGACGNDSTGFITSA